MNRIDKKFRELKSSGRKAFIAYITAGDPTIASTLRIALALESSGVDIVELGIPFSDPVADGPTIQAASQRALAGGASLRKIFAMVRSLRKNTEIPLVFMTYYNPVMQYGVRAFFESCKSSGVDGVIIPDLPAEEAKDLISLGKRSGIATIFLAAPTSPPSRLRDIAKKSRGFIYYVSLTGVTGARKRLGPELMDRVRFIKSLTDKPVAVGFGVSTPSQAKDVAKTADGVIVGSAIVKIIAARKNMVEQVSKFALALARAIHNA